jgi:hypothetical protein
VRSAAKFLLVTAWLVGAVSAQSQQPVPQPFPGAGGPQAPATRPPTPPNTGSTPATTPRPAPTAAPPAAAAPSTPQPPGQAQGVGAIPMYPTAEYLETIDAGAGQRYVIYGANVPFLDLVAYYKTTLKNGGRELFKTPGMHQFDLGRFQEDRMTYPPSIVVKDYTWNNSPGYLFVSGTTEKRYRTIIQVVAPGPTP